MSKKGDPYDNACAETFFHSFKVEAIFDEKFTGHEDLRNVIVNYIEIFYNRRRLHSYLGYKSPCEFEEAA